MVIQQTEIFISYDHSKVFSELSFDRNPLHIDNGYANRTFLGKKIFYGMGGVLLALATWAKGRPFNLLFIEGIFHHPLLENHSYKIEISNDNSCFKAKIIDNGLLMCVIRWEAKLIDSHHQNLNISNDVFIPLAEAKNPSKIVNPGSKHKYLLNKETLNQLGRFFNLSPSQISIPQLSALLWASYFVSMEYPGKRALLFEFFFKFREHKNLYSCEVRNLKYTHNARFNLVEINGMGNCISSLKLRAYKIPKKIDYPISQIFSAVGKSTKLKGKKIFISGAARGFGSVLAKMFALQGATLLLNFRNKNDLALQVKKEVQEIGGKCYIVEADLSLESSVETVRKAATNHVGSIDWIINNAAPRIPSRKFKEQTTKHYLKFFDESLSIILNTCYSLLPIMENRGWVFGISSAYLDYPKPGYSHYLASKSALEGLLLGLSFEYPKYNFAYYRAPRMLTDQTNIVADLIPPVSAIEVAKSFLSAIEHIHHDSNFVKL